MNNDPNHVIKELWAFIAVTGDAGEGIISTIVPGLGAVPLVTGRQHIVHLMKDEAKKIALRTKEKVRLVHFIKTEVLEEF